MPRPRLDAVGVTTKNMNKTVEFYRCLGFEFDEFGPNDTHVEAIAQPGEARLMIDTAEFVEQHTGNPPVAPNHSAFALLCDTPKQVDEVINSVSAKGFTVKTEPWDAFWGQRYATVVDPDGYAVDVFARLGES